VNWRIKNTTESPPGGWQFIEQATGWVLPGARHTSHSKAVKLIVQHRLANPKIAGSGSYDRAEQDLANYTAKRLKYNPRYVDPLDGEATDAINVSITRTTSGGVHSSTVGVVARPRCKTCSRKNKA